MPTPAITLTANLQTVAGGGLEGGYMRVTLCGYGSQVPSVPGTSLLADAGVPQLIGPQTSAGSPLSVQLYGNDVIVPANTFYEIAVLDLNKNVIQAENYLLTGSGTFDLSSLVPIMPPFGFPPINLRYAPCTGSGTAWVAPGSYLLGVAYNGVMLRAGLPPPLLSYTAVGTAITLTFAPDPLDKIDAFCV